MRVFKYICVEWTVKMSLSTYLFSQWLVCLPNLTSVEK